MGHLIFFNLAEMIRRYGTTVFVESGTGKGFGVRCAQEFGFERIISIEIVEPEVHRLRQWPPFATDPRVELLAGRSAEIFPRLLPTIDSPILFWLDAHFPGGDLKTSAYDAEPDEAVRLPLRTELELIRRHRADAGMRDVILIDDLRIYERDEFEWKNLDQIGQGHLARYDSRFLYTTLQETHTAQRFLQHSGYLMLLPRQGGAPRRTC
jgi:hypothetical protein